ncbi:sigma-70 family RNA polymerase sigma factor [Paenibacillus algorifonticola]|uniref:sigma-70 family RNA polymerase sigma factor n=1 Tax=Paenibacillus algorifonticola TaxID=684063 RepID=UPI003D2BD260
MYIDHLIKSAQRGNGQDYLTLFQKHEEAVYRIAFIYVKNQEDALDVVQETAYRSFKSISKLKDARYFKTWLIKIAISCSIDLLRKRQKMLQLQPEYQDLIQEPSNMDISLTLSLRELIETLDKDEKSVIMLRFYQDFTLREVKDILGIPLGTAKTILYRALRKLRLQVNEEDVYER